MNYAKSWMKIKRKSWDLEVVHLIRQNRDTKVINWNFLGLKWAVTQSFRDYLTYAAVVEIYTDCNLLVYVLSTAENECHRSKVGKWTDRL